MNVEVKGKTGTFIVPINEKKYFNFQRAYWDGHAAVVVDYTDMYKNLVSTIAFGWKVEPFPSCCGASIVHKFANMAYGNTALKDIRTQPDKELNEQYESLWEVWFKEALFNLYLPAIGLIPDTVEKGVARDRVKFYSWLKSKGKYLGQWDNPVYGHGSLINAYLFARPEYLNNTVPHA